MQSILNTINSVADFLIGIVWSNWLIYLLLLTGVFFTIITSGVQIRKLPQMVRMIFKREQGENGVGVSDYQSFVITVAARVGTGNIVGTAAAIAWGGPGAVFWMWVLALLGGATALAESTLAQTYKMKIGNEYCGGTTYMIDRALGQKWLAIVFAVLTAAAFCIGGPGVHSNAMASALDMTLNIDPTITGVILVALMAYVGIGGIKRLAHISTVISPVMTLIYLLLSVVIIVVNIGQFPSVISMIFSCAFGGNALFGGIVGSALSWGIMRGIYSNEAGMGTATFPAAAAETSHPVKQGLMQSMSVFVDTLLICSATAFMILVTNTYNVFDMDGTAIVEYLPGVEPGIGFVISAVNSFLPTIGGTFITLMLVLFSFSSLMTAFYAAETNVTYIFPKGRAHKISVWTARALVLITTFYGTQVTTSNVFKLADVGFGAMAWVNVLAILLLSGTVIKLLKDYERQSAEGLDPVFDPEQSNVKHAELWNEIKKTFKKETDNYGKN